MTIAQENTNNDIFDIVSIGGSTKDIFINSDQAVILDFKEISKRNSLIGFKYGEKIEIDKLVFDIGGGAVNSAFNFGNLGMKTSLLIKIGRDMNGEEIMIRLAENNLDRSLVLKSDEHQTGCSFILTSFEGERTVLMQRGANSQIHKDEINWELLKNTKWIYLCSMSGDSSLVVDDIADFARQNNIKLAFNPGSSQIRRGIKDLSKVLSTVDILVVNKKEASLFTGLEEKFDEYEEKNPVDYAEAFDFSSQIPKFPNLNDMFIKLKSLGPRIIVITDGNNGAQAYDGETFFYAPIFPAKPLSTLGAGDAFSSTIVASLINYPDQVERALIYASINSASIVQNFGAHQGLLTFDELEKIAEMNKTYVIYKKQKCEVIGTPACK